MVRFCVFTTQIMQLLVSRSLMFSFLFFDCSFFSFITLKIYSISAVNYGCAEIPDVILSMVQKSQTTSLNKYWDKPPTSTGERQNFRKPSTVSTWSSNVRLPTVWPLPPQTRTFSSLSVHARSGALVFFASWVRFPKVRRLKISSSTKKRLKIMGNLRYPFSPKATHPPRNQPLWKFRSFLGGETNG